MMSLRVFPAAFTRLRWHFAMLTGASALVIGSLVIAAQGAVSVDLMDVPSPKLATVLRSMVSGVASQGARTVAVGPRGLILLTEDGGGSWRQVTSPVSTDLTTVRFVGPNLVWAVGHDAVAMRSSDAGSTWERMLDGRTVLRLLRESAKGSEQLEAEIERTMGQSATADVWPAPLLDIQFSADGLTGFAVGGFGMFLKTTDGGKTWQSWQNQTENDQRYHLYALTGHDGALFVAGEQGLVMRLNAESQRFERVATPYNGTFFGIDWLGPKLVAYGLRGNAFVSDDAGQAWRKIETGIDANLVGAVSYGDAVLLVSQKGDVLAVDFGASRASTYDQAHGAEVYGAVMTGSHRLALARLNGVGVIALSAQGK
jgi:photosystem II stability/assembly factor-like uncharacterized protein